MACSLITESYIQNILWIQKYVKCTKYEKDTEKLERIQRTVKMITGLFSLEKRSCAVSHHS